MNSHDAYSVSNIKNNIKQKNSKIMKFTQSLRIVSTIIEGESDKPY